MSTDNQNEVLHASNDVATDRLETPVSNWPAPKHPGVPECLHHFLDHEFKQLAVYPDGRTPLLLTEEQYNTLRGVLGGLLPVAFELTGGETPAELWAVHAQGPDDIFPALDLAAANQQAAELNALSTPSISVGAIVIPSPLAPLEHWKAVAELEHEHNLRLLPLVAPTDANLSAMRKEGLSIDGDNAYKRDLLDTVVGALAFGKQNINPPPEGHWGQRFWDIGRAEGEEKELLAAPTVKESLSVAASDILAERQRQITAKGYDESNDDMATRGQLAIAAGCYSIWAGHPALMGRFSWKAFFPWDFKYWKPSSPRRNLIKAGALILAEIERLDRAEQAKQEQQP